MGKLEAFEILFDHPQGVFSAGQAVKGQVLVRLNEPMKMRNIRLCFRGRGKVHWSKQKGSGDNRRTVHYRAEENYFDDIFIVFGSDDSDGIMHPAGTHVYNFDFPLDSRLPSSFEGQHGYVRYQCLATIDKPWKFDHETTSAFTVLSHLDLNAEPSELHTAMQGQENTEISCCCCVSGDVSAQFRIDRRGYVPGERILVNASVQNNSNTSVSGTRVALKQYVEFYATSGSFFSSGNRHSKCESDFVASVEREEIAAGDTQVWENVPLEIPPVPPSRLVGCEIINIEYVIKFYVSVNYGSDIKLASDIVIGTVPLRNIYSNSYGLPTAVTTQPTAPAQVELALPGPVEPNAPLPNMPPPTYEECSKAARVNLDEPRDSRYGWGTMEWAPVYPIYRQPPLGPPPPPLYQENGAQD